MRIEMLDELIETIFGMEEINEEYDILEDLCDCINLND